MRFRQSRRRACFGGQTNLRDVQLLKHVRHAGRVWFARVRTASADIVTKELLKNAMAELNFYLRNIPGRPPPILAIIFDILPIFFIIVCI